MFSKASPTLSHSPIIPGVQGSPTILTEPVRRDSPPVQFSLEDREPRPYSSTGSWTRRSNGRGLSASFESPPRPPPEIWKPSSSTNPTPTPSADKNQGNEKLWSSTSQSPQRVRKGPPGANDPITVVSTLPDSRRGDPSTTTSPLTPDSPHGHTPHPPHYISSGSQMANTRRQSTDESRQYLRWYPPPKTSDFRPIRAKVSGPRVRGEGFSSRALNPASSNFEDPGSSMGETVSKFRVGKVAPLKFYPGEEAELKVKETETKQGEEELKRREELKRKGLPLLSDFDAPAWKRLISDTLLSHEITSLIETIL